MQAARDQFLAGAAFALDQHRDAGGGDTLQRGAEFLHRRTGRHQARNDRDRFPQLRGAAFFVELGDVQRARQDCVQHVDIDRLLAEIIGAELDALQRMFAAFIAGDDDDFGCGRYRQHAGDRRQAFAGAVGIGRQAEIDDGDARPFGRGLGDGGVPVAAQMQVVGAQGPAILPAQAGIVFNHEKFGGHYAAPAVSIGCVALPIRGNTICIVVPAPGLVVTYNSPPAARTSSRL